MKQFCFLSENVKNKLKIYENNLKKWQSKINLVSSSTLNDVYERHFYDSLQLWELIPKNAKTLIDFGSGAGFPALVLAILNQEENNGKIKISLVESDARKCAFIEQTARLCGVQVSIINKRIEDIEPFEADVVTARALASLDKLLDYSRDFVSDKSLCLFLKGEKVDEEIENAKKKYRFDYEKISSQTSKNSSVLIIKGGIYE